MPSGMIRAAFLFSGPAIFGQFIHAAGASFTANQSPGHKKSRG
jgi:hypothetical protein